MNDEIQDWHEGRGKMMGSRFWIATLALLTGTGFVSNDAYTRVPGAGTNVIAIEAGEIFDAKSGTMRKDQVIIVQGDRIMDVGARSRLRIPPGSRVIDLRRAAVLPGLIDGHVHLTGDEGAGASSADYEKLAADMATRSLMAGFTTQVSMGSHGGGYADIALRRDIEAGRIVGPRLMVAGPVLAIRTLPGPWNQSDGIQALRGAVRDLASNGADHVKLMTTGYFKFLPDGRMENESNYSAEQISAIVDEAHKLGLFVASHSYGGPGLKAAIAAGVDDIQHAVDVDDDDIREIVRRGLPITSTIFDLRQDEARDLKTSPYSRWARMRQSWKRMLAAGVKLGFGSGAGPVINGAGQIFDKSCNCSHGVQGEMFPVFVQWGATPVYAIRMATIVNAAIIGKQDSIGSIEKGKYADIIATAGDPIKDITQMQHVKFVMKGGVIILDKIYLLK